MNDKDTGFDMTLLERTIAAAKEREKIRVEERGSEWHGDESDWTAKDWIHTESVMWYNAREGTYRVYVHGVWIILDEDDMKLCKDVMIRIARRNGLNVETEKHDPWQGMYRKSDGAS